MTFFWWLKRTLPTSFTLNVIMIVFGIVTMTTVLNLYVHVLFTFVFGIVYGTFGFLYLQYEFENNLEKEMSKLGWFDK